MLLSSSANICIMHTKEERPTSRHPFSSSQGGQAPKLCKLVVLFTCGCRMTFISKLPCPLWDYCHRLVPLSCLLLRTVLSVFRTPLSVSCTIPVYSLRHKFVYCPSTTLLLTTFHRLFIAIESSVCCRCTAIYISLHCTVTIRTC